MKTVCIGFLLSIMSQFALAQTTGIYDNIKMEKFNDSCIVLSDEKWYKLSASFYFPAGLTNLERHLAIKFFNTDISSIEEAYKEYVATFLEKKPMSDINKAGNRLISYKAEAILYTPKKYVDVRTLFTQRLEEKKSLKNKQEESCFIYDIGKDKVLSIEDVFVPEVIEDVRQKVGESYTMMAMDDEMVVFGEKRLGDLAAFQYKFYPTYFTNDFKQLVYIDWNRVEADLKKEERERQMKDSLEILEIGPIYDVVEEMPCFPGGDKAMKQYLREHVRYPVVAEENNIQGNVICSFVVTSQGEIKKIAVVQSVDPSLDKEAIRVLTSMPKWNPGTLDGKPVSVKYTLPIGFRLYNTKAPKSK